MTDQELREAIEQAWRHTQKTAPGAELERARNHLQALREQQQRRARCEA